MIPHAPIGEPESSLANKTGSWRIFIPIFNAELCNGCGTCETFCPESVVHKRADSDTFTTDYDYCKGCGICANECPKDAIEMILEEK